jgi:hypothetical protein
MPPACLPPSLPSGSSQYSLLQLETHTHRTWLSSSATTTTIPSAPPTSLPTQLLLLHATIAMSNGSGMERIHWRLERRIPLAIRRSQSELDSWSVKWLTCDRSTPVLAVGSLYISLDCIPSEVPFGPGTLCQDPVGNLGGEYEKSSWWDWRFCVVKLGALWT